ncbi:hypothetical protein [Aeoliella mucimassa]|uniref:Uncharacterized protein n=1 Tax=Aeoliella mucimassa TaxID=2527972 RepID=A0A518AUP2_9BACT|nr:hypothetical protein [Aeoliella mucimassa]QDU58432.1 hypothetical protein Pan181_46680 [Aeoliella mucimassa]
MDLIQTIRITPKDFDSDVGGWRVPFLQLPGIQVKEVHFDGERIDLGRIELDGETGTVRFEVPSGKTRRLTIVCAMPKEILLPGDVAARERAQARMNWLKTVMPILAGLVLAFAKPIAEFTVPAMFAADSPVVEVSVEPLSNDILDEVWKSISASDEYTNIAMVGLNFHRTALDGDDHLLNAVRNGSQVRIVVPEPSDELYKRYEVEYGADSNQLKAECELGLEALRGLQIECGKITASSKSTGSLSVRTVDYMPNARMYRFDRGGGGSECFVVNYIRGRKSSDTPALVFHESSRLDDSYKKWFEHVWSGAEEISTSSEPQSQGS